MKNYGHFDDNAREYVIREPKTPFPWINYLGNRDFFSLISNTSGGYSFYKDARLMRITRYRYNNVPLDSGGKYLYINDNGVVWNPGWKPVKTPLDFYECRHGLGYTTITGSKNQLTVETTSFVPIGSTAEVQMVKLTNCSGSIKKIKLFSMVEWCLWNAMDDMTNFQRNLSIGEVEIEGSTIFHKTEYRERRNHFAFFFVNEPLSGFDTDRDTFLGAYNGFDEPERVFSGQSGQSHAHGWSPIASHCLEIELSANETKDLVFVLGYVENPDNEKFSAHQVINKKPAYELISKFDSTAKANLAFGQLKEYWQSLLSIYQVKSPDDKLNRMVNIWNQYQCMVTFNMSRSASFFESGIGRGMGFRDSNQDLIGFVHLVPENARERILDIAATQFEDGGAYHQYQPLTKKGNSEVGGNFNDDPLWLILSTASYIKETGDISILQENVPFDNDHSKAKPLFDHLTASFNHVIQNLGPHGLPLIGRADWNDCLNLNCFSSVPGEPFQTTGNRTGGVAESVFIAGLFVLYGAEYANLCQFIGKSEEAARANRHVDEMKKKIELHGWDGEWFLRAYDYFGNKIGSKENDEGQIFIESQGICTMAGIGKENGRAALALKSVKERLDCPYGIVLQNPPYSKYYLELGEISTYPEGYKENAGIFCHNNPWIMIGETVLGNGNQAFEYYSKIAPSYLEPIAELHKTEPYVYSQMIAGKDAFKPGEAKNSWLTGTAAWNFYTISQYILGIRPEYDGLLIDPCIPSTLLQFEVIRKFRGADYIIRVNNPEGNQKGVKKILLNGIEIPGIQLPLAAKGTVNQVEVFM